MLRRSRRAASPSAAPRRRGRPAGLSHEPLEPRALLTAFSFGGGVLDLVIDNLDEAIVTTATGGDGYSVTTNRVFTGLDVPGKLVGNGTNTLTVSPSLGVVTAFITDTALGATVTFGTSAPGATYDADFILSLAIPGSGTVNFDGATAFSGAHSLSVTAARIDVNAALSSASGFLTLDAEEGFQSVGVAAGVAISATGSVTTAGGSIDISGRGGDGILGDQVGITVLGSVSAGDDGTTFGKVTLTGIGGASSGEGTGNHGVVVGPGASVSSTGGAISITGTGASVNGDAVGVVLAGLVRTLSAAGAPGDVVIEGFGGGAPVGTSGNYGIWLQTTGEVRTAAGSVSATGHAGVGNPLGFFPYTDSPGLYDDNGSVVSATGALSFTADSFFADLASGGVISTAGTVSIRNLLAGQVFDLGPDLNPFLEAIVASRLIVGRDDVQPVITQGTAPGGTLSLPAGTALELIGSSISLRAPVTTPGAAQRFRGPVRLGDLAPSADVTLGATAARFDATIDGGGRSLSILGDAEFRGAVGGLVDLLVSGATIAAADVTTSGQQSYSGTVTLDAPLVTLTAASGSFGAGVAGAGRSLAIDFAGTTAIDGALFTGLAALSTGNGGTTTLAGVLTTAGTQTFGDSVVLAADTTLASGGGNVVFSSSLDGARNLALAAGSGLVRFEQAVGSGFPLASLLVSSAWGVTALSTVAIDGSAPGAAVNGLVLAGVGNVDMQVPGSSVRNSAGSGVLLISSAGTSLAGFTIRDHGAYGVYVSGNSPGTSLRGSTIAGNAVGVYLSAAGGMTIEAGNLIVGNDSYGIYATGVATQTTSIRGNTVDGSGSGVYGVFLDDAKNIHLGEAGNGNLITASMIGIQASAGLGSSAVIDNRVEANGSGIVLDDARHLAISGDNRIAANPSYGLLARGVFIDTVVSGATISGSTVGMCLSGATGLSVQGGNVVRDNSAHALYAVGDGTGTVVRGNTFAGMGAGTVGVFLDGVDGLALGGIDPGAGNVVRDAAVGIWARGTLGGSSVRGNTVDTNGSGVVLADATGLVVDGGNVVSRASAYGLLVSGDATGTTFSGNVVDTNVAGVVLSAATSATIGGGNTITGSSAFGVFIGGVSTGSRVSGNTISGGGSFGAFLDGATGATLGDGNVLSGWTVGVYARGALDGSEIRANTVTGGTAGAILSSARGLGLAGGNRFTAASAYGILAEGDCSGTSIAGNTVDQNVVGIWLAGATGLAVQGSNQIVANTAHGIYAAGDATGTRVVGNTVNGSSVGAHGVFLDGVSGLALGGSGAGELNTVTGSAVGIFARGSLAGSSVVGTMVSGNQTGLLLSGARGLVVNGGNHFVGSAAFGLYGTGDCEGTLVEGSQIESNSSGVVLEDARGLSIVNANRLVSNTAFGLYAKGNSTGTTVVGNTISGNGLNIDTTAAVGGTFQAS